MDCIGAYVNAYDIRGLTSLDMYTCSDEYRQSGIEYFDFFFYAFRLLGLVPTVMDGGRKLAVYMHREDTPTSDYSPVGIAMHLTCLADLYLAQGIDHTKLVLVIDMRTVRLGHLARYPLGLLRRFFLYAWVSRI